MDARTINIANDGDAEDVVMAFATTGGGAADLEAWMARYPGEAGELARFAARQWAHGGGAVAASPDDAARTARMREIGITALRACQAQSAAEYAPFVGVLEAASARGLTPALLAARLGLTAPYIAKLHRRMFAFASLPAALINDLADALGRSADEVSAYLGAGGPQMARGASFSSESRPEATEAADFQTAIAGDAAVSKETRARYGRG